ncbi:hypothetical protein [Lactobacillus sp. UCMA15818]|uniref:hypothetical protein n=1 Tax=Lactobacillaceae TaxID=33958 RepID=UPI0025B00994|nr:hypothetical protein [Lactobacillus sp. UCMA15818]MDN2452484.1 hypothetical protein [Lactobacillus sp. UCMA15818]
MGLKDKIFGKVGRHSQSLDIQETTRKKENAQEIPEETVSRSQQRQDEKNEINDEKKRKLARKLNWVIAGLFMAIICVYCFMVFVNF